MVLRLTPAVLGTGQIKPALVGAGANRLSAERKLILADTFDRWATQLRRSANRELWAERKSGKCNKLDWKKVSEIRALLADKVNQSKIAKQFGVLQSTISDIKKGVTWSY